MADKFEDLRTFVTVVDTGGIGTAAAQLGIVKSAVSRRLSDLEDRLGVTLITRTTRTLELTETGRRFLVRARALLSELDGLERIGSVAGEEVLEVSVDAALAPAIIPSLVALKRALPDLRVALADGPADVALSLAGLAAGKDRRGRTLATTPVVHCAAPSYLERRGTPVTSEDLGSHDLISTIAGASAARAGERGWLRAADDAAAIAAAIAGVGIATVPLAAIVREVAAGTLVRVAPEPSMEPRHVVATMAGDAPASAAMLVDRIAADLRKALGTL